MTDLLPEAPRNGEESQFMERHRIDPKAVALIKANNPGLTDADLGRFLEVAAHLQLNPLIGEIYCSRGRGRDGAPGRLLFMVGRDGLLKNAQRYPDYRGWDGDVVHEHDEFRVVRSAGGAREIQHSYGKPTERGKIVGAWATVYREGRPPTYFYAPFDEYCPRSASTDSPWVRQPSVMIAKVPLSLCLRLAFQLSGVVGEDEGARALEYEPDEPPPPQQQHWIEELELPLREELRSALQDVKALGEPVDDAVLEMRVRHQPDDAVRAFIGELNARAMELMDARVQEAFEPPDAEVIDDPAGPDFVAEPRSDVTPPEDPPSDGVAAAAAAETADDPVPWEDSPRMETTELDRFRARLTKLIARRDTEDLESEQIALIDEEIDFLEGEIVKAETVEDAKAEERGRLLL